jgi:molybdopterin converting factor small subunit
LGARNRIHPLLQDIVHGQAIVEVEGRNLGECLADLEKKYPEMENRFLKRRVNCLNRQECLLMG